MILKMGKVRLENAFGESGINATVQKAETIRNPDGSIEHMLSCYHPNIECKDRKTYEAGGIKISTYCPFIKCDKKKD